MDWIVWTPKKPHKPKPVGLVVKRENLLALLNVPSDTVLVTVLIILLDLDSYHALQADELTDRVERDVLDTKEALHESREALTWVVLLSGSQADEVEQRVARVDLAGAVELLGVVDQTQLDVQVGTGVVLVGFGCDFYYFDFMESLNDQRDSGLDVGEIHGVEVIEVDGLVIGGHDVICYGFAVLLDLAEC